MNINIDNLFKMHFAPFYEMSKEELSDYLKNELEFNDNTYPHLDHKEVLNYDEEKLRELVIEIVDHNESCTIIG